MDRCRYDFKHIPSASFHAVIYWTVANKHWIANKSCVRVSLLSSACTACYAYDFHVKHLSGAFPVRCANFVVVGGFEHLTISHHNLSKPTSPRWFILPPIHIIIFCDHHSNLLHWCWNSFITSLESRMICFNLDTWSPVWHQKSLSQPSVCLPVLLVSVLCGFKAYRRMNNHDSGSKFYRF